MSDAGDGIEVDPPAVAEVEVAAEAPKGKLSVEDALQVNFLLLLLKVDLLNPHYFLASTEECTCPRRFGSRSS